MEKEIKEKTFDEIQELINDIPHYIIVAKQDSIPGKLKEWRIYRDLTLRDIEIHTGISNSYLSQLETGKVNKPSFEVICKLCRVYNVRLIID